MSSATLILHSLFHQVKESALVRSMLPLITVKCTRKSKGAQSETRHGSEDSDMLNDNSLDHTGCELYLFSCHFLNQHFCAKSVAHANHSFTSMPIDPQAIVCSLFVSPTSCSLVYQSVLHSTVTPPTKQQLDDNASTIAQFLTTMRWYNRK